MEHCEALEISMSRILLLWTSMRGLLKEVSSFQGSFQFVHFSIQHGLC